MFSFNLIEEKWLPCIMQNGELKELSLRETLTQTSDIKELNGDSPPVTIALHRLLLAILHRSLNAPRSYEEWGDYWIAKNWNADGILDSYLSEWAFRFDLFDKERPFYQVSTIAEKVQDGAIIQLDFQGKNNSTLFEHSTLPKPNVVTPAEAARMLVTTHGFDYGGIKADGSAQKAPLLQNAVALIRGDNLFETLMLNWHAYDEEDGEPFDFSYAEDLPPWERETETESMDRIADGYVDLLTWQSRTILLEPELDENDETVIKNTVIMKGFQFPKDFEFQNRETMMAFKKSKSAGYREVRFSEYKSLWRNSLPLFQTVPGESAKPKVLDWLEELEDRDQLKERAVYPVDFFGIVADKSKLISWHQERFFIPLAILKDQNLLNKIELALNFAEDVGIKVLSFSVGNLAKTLETDRQSFSAIQVYWAALEIQFKQFLVDLSKDQEQAIRDWFQFTDTSAKEALQETLRSLSGSAIEQKARVEAEKSFYNGRKKLLNKNPKYKELLPKHKTHGGEQ